MTERHALILLVVVLVAQLLLLALQVRQGEEEATVAEGWALRLVGPLSAAVDTVAGTVQGAGEELETRERLERQNRELRERIEELELELFRLRNVEEERDRLAAALETTAEVPGTLRPTRVVYLDHASWLRTLILFVGERPARVDQPVLTPEGLVGRVIATAGPYAKVQLLTDRAAAVSAIIERTRRQALVRGGTEHLELDFVPVQASVERGDRVLTAGTDGIYPRGIPVGTVVDVEAGGELFRQIQLTPAVDFSHLDRVYLLESERIPEELMEEGPVARR